jgi:hypothetical protein
MHNTIIELSIYFVALVIGFIIIMLLGALFAPTVEKIFDKMK